MMLSMRKKSYSYDNQLLPFDEFNKNSINDLLELWEDNRIYGDKYVLKTYGDIKAFVEFTNDSNINNVNNSITINTVFDIYTEIYNDITCKADLDWCVYINPNYYVGDPLYKDKAQFMLRFMTGAVYFDNVDSLNLYYDRFSQTDIGLDITKYTNLRGIYIAA